MRNKSFDFIYFLIAMAFIGGLWNKSMDSDLEKIKKGKRKSFWKK